MGFVRLGTRALHAGPAACTRQRLATTMLVCVLAWTGAGCDSMARLKGRLHQASDEAQSDDPVALGLCGLDVLVTPASGMSVLIDGEPLGHTSPACHRGLSPGAHTVYVRAMGYYSIALPVTLVQGQILRLPVALRPRAPTPFSGTVAEIGPKASPAETVPDARPTAGVAEHGRTRAAATLPPQVTGTLLPESSAIALHMVAQPQAPIVVDNEATDGRSVRLRRARGTLAIGNLVFRYSINPGRLVDFSVPSDGCQWYRDGAQVKPGSDLRLGRGLLRLKRVAPGGQEQAVVLRRLG